MPLPSLLSQALAAFIIEFDNEFEHRTPHRTKRYGKTPGAQRVPWLVSMAMWTKFLQFVPDDGTSGRELVRATGLPVEAVRPWIIRLSKWWGYLKVERDQAGTGWTIRPTAGGAKALAVWRPLTGEIEQRWYERFGEENIDQLRNALDGLIRQFDVVLPDSLPILGYGLLSRAPEQAASVSSERLPLPAALSKVVLKFALEFEDEAGLSLAISANVLRVAADDGVRVRDMPRLSGVSKEAIAVALSFLEKQRYAVVETEPSGRAKMIRLTPKGWRAAEKYEELVESIETRWREQYDDELLTRLRDALEQLVGDGTAANSPLFRGLEPYPDGWRAAVPKPAILPHFPMILHRGGYPDGS